jgi:hypothetical protein
MDGNNDHADAIELSLRQLDARYGSWNVYGECPVERRFLHGQPGTGGKLPNTFCFYTTTPGSCPDIIVGMPADTFVYEVKPGTDQLSEIKPGVTGERGLNNASQIQRYLWALAYAGYPNVATGRDIAPDQRTYADGSVLTIFSGADWDSYARKGSRKARDYSGIIYYLKTDPPRVPAPRPPNNPNNPPNNGTNEEPNQQPRTVPTTRPVDDPVTSDIGGDLAVGAAVVVAVVVVVVLVVIFWPVIVEAATAVAAAALLKFAFDW